MNDAAQRAPAGFRRHDHFNPVTVTMHDTTGLFVLGAVALLLLIALLRSEARNRALLRRLATDQEI